MINEEKTLTLSLLVGGAALSIIRATRTTVSTELSGITRQIESHEGGTYVRRDHRRRAMRR